MITVAPIAPPVGLKAEINGLGNTVKFDVLVMVMPLVVTEIGPVTALSGTSTVILFALDVVTFEAIPLNDTAGDGLKCAPVIITVAPIAPLVGLNPVISGVGKIVKLEALAIVTPLTVTEISPVDASAGTVVVMVVEVEDETLAGVPLNLTLFSDGVVLKFVPVMVTVAPSAPVPGVKPEMVGEANTVKLLTLVSVTALVVTEMGPDAAPDGTLTVMLVAVDDTISASADIPLNVIAVMVVKFSPVIVTVAPGAPLVGLKLVIEGVGSTVKLDGLETVTPFKVNVTGPDVAPAGTVTVSLLLFGFELFTNAGDPLN